MKKSELRDTVREIIRKVGDEYAVYPKKGGKRLGTHKTRKGAEDQMTAIHISKYGENLDPSYKHDGKAAPYGSGYRPLKEQDPKTGTGKKPKGSGRRLYTDENPKDTVSVKFRTKEDIVDTLNKSDFKSKSHARQSQVINLIHQRVRAAHANAKDSETKSRLKRALDYIEGRKEASKKKTERLKNMKEQTSPDDPKALSPQELEKELKKVDDWHIRDSKLSKRYQFKTFPEAINFINKIADIFEKENHHPIVRNFYSTIDLQFYSGFADDKITSLDFKLARMVDAMHKSMSLNELNCAHGQYFCPHDKVYKCRKGPKKSKSENVHKPMNPGILKKRLGKLSCSKVRAERSKLKDKGTTYAKALQRYLNYHCQ